MFRILRNRRARQTHGLTKPIAREVTYTADVGGRQAEMVRSRFMADWLGQLDIAPRVILDLGSYDGGDSRRLAQAFPDCRVIAVEADPTRLEIVRANLEGTAVEVVNAAVCESDGPVPWFAARIDGAVHAQGSVFRHSDRYRKSYPFVKQEAEAAEVPGRRFDSLMAELGVAAVDLLHMDIEGAEGIVLRSMGAVRPALIYMEWRDHFFEGAETAAERAALMDGLGYALLLDLGEDRLYLRGDLAGG